MLKTYDVKCGTVGISPDGDETILFPTEDEAIEYLKEQQESDDSED